MPTKAQYIHWGIAAMETDPDYEQNGPRENAIDVIGNVLHAWQAQSVLTDEEANAELGPLFDMVAVNFNAETIGGETDEA